MILMLGLLSLKDLKSIWVEISGIEMGEGGRIWVEQATERTIKNRADTLTWNLVIVLIHIQSWKLKSAQHTCTQMFTETLFIVVRTWMQSRCPSVSEWINCGIYPDSGILFNTERKWINKPWKDMEETKIHITKWKKPIRKGYILYDCVCVCVYILFWTIMKPVKRVKRSTVARGWREGRINRWNIEDF